MRTAVRLLCVFMNKCLTVILVILLISCSKVGEAPERTFDHSKEFVDLSIEIRGNWKQVCIITPYSNNQSAEDLIGFKFDIETKSKIHTLDGITLLVATDGNKVFEYFEVPRNNLDFSSLKSSCYSKDDSKFKIIKRNGWNGVQHI